MSTNLALRSDPAGFGAIVIGSTDVVEIDASGIRKGAGTRLAQTVEYKTGAVATGQPTIPWDDTIPTIAEGTQFLSATITPQNALSRLEVEVVAHVASSLAATIIACALFRDAATYAVEVGCAGNINANDMPEIDIDYSVVAGSTAPTTFSVRVGSASPSTVTLNGAVSARKYGGVLISSITIKEYLP